MTPSLEEMFERIAPHIHEMHVYPPGERHDNRELYSVRFCRLEGRLRSFDGKPRPFREAVESLFEALCKEERIL